MLAFVEIVRALFKLYQLVLVLYAVMTWFPNAFNTKFGKFIYKLSRPYLDIFDRYIPSFGGISFNVIIAILVLRLAEYGVMLILRVLLSLFGSFRRR